MNAFNTENCGRIVRALFKMDTPQYLKEIFNNCFQDRRVISLTDDGENEYVVMTGVPPGSALGPLF